MINFKYFKFVGYTILGTMSANDIKELEQALPCIKKANNMSDMMKCQGMQ
jgi:hypothetical protein